MLGGTGRVSVVESQMGQGKVLGGRGRIVADLRPTFPGLILSVINGFPVPVRSKDTIL